MGGLVRYRVQPGGKEEEERGKCNFRTNCNSPTISRTRWPLNWPDSPFLMRRFMIKCYDSIHINTSKEKVRSVYASDASNSSEYLNWRRTLSAHFIDAKNAPKTQAVTPTAFYQLFTPSLKRIATSHIERNKKPTAIQREPPTVLYLPQGLHCYLPAYIRC